MTDLLFTHTHSPACDPEGRAVRIVQLLTAGPHMHETCCRWECHVCAGRAQDCERCVHFLLEMADDACNWADLCAGRAMNAASS